ncbi:MAG TPA: VWA domain-containing protein [Gemmataceae bacterium]|jgi:Ca-activated chloride channel family protein
MRFANPEAFLFLPVVALAVGYTLRSRSQAAARFSSLRLTAALPTGWAIIGPALLITSRTLALTALVFALARPQTPNHTEQIHTDGIAIQLILDISASMETRDYAAGSVPLSRLQAVKQALRLFVEGGQEGLSGRPNDKIGIITFAREPEVVCPLTLDHSAVLEALDRIRAAPPVGTNIGDALAWGLDRLHRESAKQKIIILLSDGAHNVKDAMTPVEAAQLAADLKIKVHTIGAIGNRSHRLNRSLADLIRSLQKRSPNMAFDDCDEPAMQKIADLTGGRYYRSTDTSGLTAIYRDIDRLETTPIEKTIHTTYREWFWPLVVLALGLLAMEQLLASTRCLRVP